MTWEYAEPINYDPEHPGKIDFFALEKISKFHGYRNTTGNLNLDK